LITGGSGFISSYIATSIHHRGYEVVIANNFPNNTEEAVADDAVLIDADLTTQEAPERLISTNLDIVFNLDARKTQMSTVHKDSLPKNHNGIPVVGTVPESWRCCSGLQVHWR